MVREEERVNKDKDNAIKCSRDLKTERVKRECEGGWELVDEEGS